MVAAEKKPVAAPSHVAMHCAATRHIKRNLVQVAPGRYVAHADRTVFMQRGLHIADRGFDGVRAPAQVRKTGDHQTRGFTAAVRVDHFNGLHGCQGAGG